MDLARVFNGKKYMWDGRIYETKKDMKKTAEEYVKGNFEVEEVEEEGKHYLFTRRVVTEVVVEGSPI
jgi:hypothetical protein